MSDGARPTLFVKVYSAFSTLASEQCYSVTAVNHTGQFDVLPFHKNFITVLEPCEVVIVNSRETTKIPINRGVMYVHDNKVTVFLDV
jgi:F0F1-type ATP synthase epsilon subunit